MCKMNVKHFSLFYLNLIKSKIYELSVRNKRSIKTQGIK